MSRVVFRERYAGGRDPKPSERVGVGESSTEGRRRSESCEVVENDSEGWVGMATFIRGYL